MIPRVKSYPGWLARVLGLISPLFRQRGRFQAPYSPSGTANRHLSTTDADILSGERARLTRQIEDEDRQAAGAIAVAGLSTLDLDDLLQRLVVRMVEVSGATVGGILLLDETDGTLHPGAYHGLPVEDLHAIKVPLGKGFAGRVASERRPLTLRDADRNPDLVNPYIRQRGIKSMLGTPILVGERLLGVAHVDRLDDHVFTPMEVRRLKGMAAQAALAIYHVMLHQQLEAANRELASANRRLQEVISATPAGVAILGAPEGRVIAANGAAERLWGHPLVPEAGAAELATAYGLFHLNGEPYEASDLPMVRSLQTGETVAGEEVILRQPNGREILALLSSAPLRGDDGAVQGAVAVFQDTSGMELERMKDQFISVTAHELFTPLTVVKGTAQLLSRRLGASGADALALDGLRMIDGRANWMTYLVQKLVDAAELQLGPLHLRRGAVDLAPLTAAAVRRMQMTTRKHEVVFVGGVEHLLGHWDRERIDRVLTNLIENAIKFSPGGGRVEVSLAQVSAAHPFDRLDAGKRRGWAVVRVRDHGEGIPKERQAHLFRRFYRAGPAHYQESSGLGLGLYVSNRIVAAHGGQVTMESKVGEGSTFSFALPLEQEPAAA